MNTEILIIIPAFNEEESIASTCHEAQKHGAVLVIDDCSTDGTADIVNKIPNILYLRNDKNSHIRRTLIRGFEFASQKGFKYVCTLDAGNSYRPEEIFKHFKGCPENLIGQRGPDYSASYLRKIISKMASFLFLILTLLKLRRWYYLDATCGLRIYTGESINTLLKHHYTSNSYGFHFESLFVLLKNKNQIKRIPVSYQLTNTAFNIRALNDGFKAFLRLLCF